MTQETIDQHNQECEELKKTIPHGPWIDEPNRLNFTHAGLDCMIVRNPMLALCGYVGVPMEHPDHGKDYSEMYEHTQVHGSLTFSDSCQEDGPVCHVTDGPDDTWWFGFDCAHFLDIIPKIDHLIGHLIDTMNILESWDKSNGTHKIMTSTYKDIEYVTDHVKALAEQLKARAND